MNIFIYFVCLFSVVCTQYPYQGYYSSPSQRPCGNSYCQYMPCYGQRAPSINQYPLQNNQYLQLSNQFYGQRASSINQYPLLNNQYSQLSNQYPQQYASPYLYQYPPGYQRNLRPQFMDESSMRKLLEGQTQVRQNQFTNVPTEVIDENQYNSFMKNFMKSLPKLPKVTQTSHSNYTVSKGSGTSSTVNQIKPVKAVITRSFQPQKNNPILNLNFVNGEPATTSTTTQKTTTQVVTTLPTTTEVDESVESVNDWVFSG